MKLLAFLLRRSPTGLPVAVLLGLASGIASTGLLAVAHQAIDSLQTGLDPSLLWIFIALCVVVPALRTLSQYMLVALSQNMVLELRMHLARRILATPLARIESHGAPRLLASLIDDVNVLGEGLMQIPILSLSTAIVLGAFGYMAWLSPPLFMVLMVVMVLGIATYRLPFLWGYRFFGKARKEKDELFDHLRSLTDGIRELKLHRRRNQALLDHLESSGKTMHRSYIWSYTIFGAAASWGQLLFFVVIGVLIFAVPLGYEVSTSTLIGYTLALLYLMNPLHAILDFFPILSRAGVALEKVEALGLSLASPPSKEEVAQHQERLDRWQRLELRGIRYAYGDEDHKYRFTFGPVDLTFEPGELVFFVGGNGSGKTTFVKLLTGLYAPDEGQILLGDTVIGDAQREDYRQFFSLVFADPYLFQHLLGLEAPSLDEAAQTYLRELELHEKVEIRDGALSTTALSQGQRKRLALLTAYLEDRPAYIFDEWAADQDPTFREVFYYKILPELKARGKTLFVISHDDRYYGVADRIIKLDSGQVVFDGPPNSFPTASLSPSPSTLDESPRPSSVAYENPSTPSAPREESP